MNEKQQVSIEQYIDALSDFLSKGGETALQRAYELGRKALDTGVGLLAMVAIYREALGMILVRSGLAEERLQSIRKTYDFFSESLSPFEMAQRGFQENISNLQHRTLELELVNKELESFSYSVSHDLQAPLRSIDGFSQALFEDCFDKLDEQGKDHLQRIRKATQLMSELIDALLVLSRVTRVEIKRESVDLSGMAKAIAEELRRTQPERKADFLIAEGLTATGDLRLLRVVLENLIGNAWKFTSKQENARIELGLLKQSRGRPAYFVRDNGSGFNMDNAGKLFNAFQRLHSAGEFPGTGIGLATVKRIIHRHGGCVWAEGEVDKGATFYFTL
jgi:light-regulated signal transduction histidine kinase (bacteriophytochrome)